MGERGAPGVRVAFLPLARKRGARRLCPSRRSRENRWIPGAPESIFARSQSLR